MNQFYVPSDQFAGNLVIIGEEEARHIIRVLRYGEGDELLITDGKGKRYRTVIEATTKRNLHCKILDTETVEPAPAKVLVMGYLRMRQRMEWAVEKATELGVSKIIICHTKNCEPGKVKTERIQQIQISAMKQSGRVYLPEFAVAKNLSAAIDMTKSTERIVAHEKADGGDWQISAKPVSLWVGPEGGFDAAEISQLIDAGAKIVSLGRYRLRAETAAVVMCGRGESSEEF